MSVPNVSFQPGDRQVVGLVVGGELDEAADRRTALVQLAGRVQEARAVADGHGALECGRAAAGRCRAAAASRSGVGATNAWMLK